MQKLTIEFPPQFIDSFGLEGIFSKIKKCEILHILKYEKTTFVCIAQLEKIKPNKTIKNLIGNSGITQIEILNDEKGIITCILTCSIELGVEKELKAFLNPLSGFELILDLPITCTRDNLICSFIGKKKRIDDFINLIRNFNINARMLKIQDAKLDYTPLISDLTIRQREILLLAKKLGYFDIPRKITSERLAEILEISKVAVLEHLRKAERNIINKLF